ncbi:hypothetical protein BD560DRAFT_406872 [Blakeslea trispora]|nr:hypothetical protein BD560DRAFT_406872 [Blakeslea trispora]
MEYDPANKASSVTSTSTTCSLWDSLPSLYTGRADSVSSAYDELEPFEEGLYLYDKQENPVLIDHNEQSHVSDLLNTFLEEEKELVILDHEEPSSPSLCHGNRKRSCQPEHTKALKKLKQDENRELLSDDQKRANHIASEQKRRNIIRGGFKELTEIIPTLKNINNSKSTILFKSVDYIKQLDKRNKTLKEKLASLQNRVQQKALKKLSPNAVAALVAHKSQQKQLELLQEQLRLQQVLLTKHNIHASLYPTSSLSLHPYHQTATAGLGYHSISIPAMDDTPVTSTNNSPTLSHASLPVNRSHPNVSSHAALIMPASLDEWQHAGITSFTIPADESDKQSTFRERLLSSGKLDHLKPQSMDQYV